MSSFDDIASVVEGEAISWPVAADRGRSFAQMLQTNGSRKTAAWPSLSCSRKVASDAPITGSPVQQATNVDPEMEEYAPPAYSQSLGDALAQALEKSELLNQGAVSTDNVVAGGKKKKKKAKATVLFATNMARAS